MGKGFKDLLVWKKARDLAVSVYTITKEHRSNMDFALIDQMRRSSVSVPSNIAEGDERDTDKEAIRFFYIAKGSLAELRTQMEIAYLTKCITKDIFIDFDENAVVIGKMLGSLIKARSKTHNS